MDAGPVSAMTGDAEGGMEVDPAAPSNRKLRRKQRITRLRQQWRQRRRDAAAAATAGVVE